MGIPPMEAMSSLYIVNGKVTMWGMALSKRLREHGWKIEYLESTETVARVKIMKGDESYEYTATPGELKNSQAMKFAPKDKLKWHALSRLVRFSVPEILGPVSYLAEEAEEFIEASVVETKAGPTLEDLISDIQSCDTIEKYTAKMAELSKLKTILTDDEKQKLFAVALSVKKSLEEKVEEAVEVAEVSEPQEEAEESKQNQIS
jgi:hypothetical protein